MRQHGIHAAAAKPLQIEADVQKAERLAMRCEFGAVLEEAVDVGQRQLEAREPITVHAHAQLCKTPLASPAASTSTPYANRDARHAIAGFAQIDKPSERAAARISALRKPSSLSGLSIECAAPASWPGR